MLDQEIDFIQRRFSRFLPIARRISVSRWYNRRLRELVPAIDLYGGGSGIHLQNGSYPTPLLVCIVDKVLR